MELAIKQGFDIRVVALPKGKDPADDPQGFEDKLSGAKSYAVYRVELEIERTPDRQLKYLRAQEILNSIPESPERHDAWRLANDRLGLTVQLRATGGSAGLGAPASAKMIDAGDRLERSALAGVRAHPTLNRVLAELGPEHFDSEIHRRAREYLLASRDDGDDELTALLAELDARAAEEAIDEATGKQLLLRLRERKLSRDLEAAADERLPDLQHALAEVRTAIREFA
jgi:hypothetical protein